jgi:hypothetical protein
LTNKRSRSEFQNIFKMEHTTEIKILNETLRKENEVLKLEMEELIQKFDEHYRNLMEKNDEILFLLSKMDQRIREKNIFQ